MLQFYFFNTWKITSLIPAWIIIFPAWEWYIQKWEVHSKSSWHVRQMWLNVMIFAPTGLRAHLPISGFSHLQLYQTQQRESPSPAVATKGNSPAWLCLELSVFLTSRLGSLAVVLQIQCMQVPKQIGGVPFKKMKDVFKKINL